MLSQKPQLCTAMICRMDMAALSPAGASTISEPERPNSGQDGVPFAFGSPVAAKWVTEATSSSCSACWLASSAGVTGFRYQAPICEAPCAVPAAPERYGGMSLASISYPYTVMNRDNSLSVTSDGHTVSESAATVRNAIVGESKCASGYSARTAGAYFPYWDWISWVY